MTTMTVQRPPVSAATFHPDVSTPALLLKFDPNVMHHGGLGAIRSLGRMGVPVYAMQESAWAPAGHSRYLHGKVLWQPGRLAPDRVRAGLLRIAELIGRPAVLIPTDDAGAIFLAEHADGLRQQFLFSDPPAGLPRELAGKHSLHRVCAAAGFPSPQCSVPATLAEAAAAAAGYGYPVVGKLARPWLAAAGQHSTQIIGGPAELAAAWGASRVSQAGLMLQEFIPAAPGHDWFFHGYAGAGGTACKPACTGVKDRSYPARAGLTSFGRCVPNTELRDSVTSMLARIGYRGLADLDLRLDARDGQYKLLDFNPRLGAQFRLFTGAGGLDVVRAAYLDLTGQPVMSTGPGGGDDEPAAGRSFMVESYDPLTAISYWRSGELAPRAWLAAAREVDEKAWFAADDLRPFELMCARMGARMITRPLAGRVRRPWRRRAPDPDHPPVPRLRRGRSESGRS